MEVSAGTRAAVVWHDLECGSYRADLPLWLRLAQRRPRGMILDVGAGTGRVSLFLARAGRRVLALDREERLLEALRERAGGLPVRTIRVDAREFSLTTEDLAGPDARSGDAGIELCPVPMQTIELCLVPMQTIQLLGGREQRLQFLRCARAHLAPGGLIAVALADALEPFDIADGVVAPLPDVGEIDGVVYSSCPTAIRELGDAFVLERRRETVSPSGDLVVEPDVIRLDRLDADMLEQEAREAGLAVGSRAEVPPTPDYAGSAVVTLHA